MNATIKDLMSRAVISAKPEDTVSDVQRVLSQGGISALPILDGEGSLMGIVTSTDVLKASDLDLPVTEVMSERVYTVPPSAGVHIAARIMRNHHTHHVVVTHNDRVVGMIASYDLLRLVEEHRYVSKEAPSVPRRKHLGRREKRERALAKERHEEQAREG
jgi:CBS domain-containing protein